MLTLCRLARVNSIYSLKPAEMLPDILMWNSHYSIKVYNFPFQNCQRNMGFLVFTQVLKKRPGNLAANAGEGRAALLARRVSIRTYALPLKVPLIRGI